MENIFQRIPANLNAGEVLCNFDYAEAGGELGPEKWRKLDVPLFLGKMLTMDSEV